MADVKNIKGTKSDNAQISTPLLHRFTNGKSLTQVIITAQRAQ
jgi:hypothetical protein